MAADFEDLGWGPVANTNHDLGTDLFVQARDYRGFHRGLFIGVQVKSGSSYFKPEVSDKSGQRVGWYYRESDADHFDDWVTHCLPHLLVLHDPQSRVSYWTHVTADAVESSGKGCKILVPATQTITNDNGYNLFEVARQQKAAPDIEGTVFHGMRAGIPLGRRLRYALIAPRLIAPHHNVGIREPVDAEQAVALLSQGRFRALDLFARRHSSVPDPRCASPHWAWSFVSAIWEWMKLGSIEKLRTAHCCAPTRETKAASGVLLACALRRLGDYEQALTVLDSLVKANELAPVDQGWVLVHRARTRVEVGNIAGAHNDVTAALRSLAGDDDDITVSPLASAAVWQIFATSDSTNRNGPDGEAAEEEAVNEEEAADDEDLGTFRDIGEILTASDTAVSWWRSQMVAWGLAEVQHAGFRSWAEQAPSIRLGDEGHYTDLLAAEFNADICGDHEAWKSISALRARQRLIGSTATDAETGELVRGLDSLRLSGDSHSLRIGVSHLHAVGPIDAVAEAARKVRADRWTRTASLSNFEMLAAAGDLLDEQAATELLSWCRTFVHEDSDETLPSTHAMPGTASHVIRAISGLFAATGDRMQSQMATLVSKRTDLTLHVPVSEVRNVVSQLDFGKIGAAGHTALWEFGRQQENRLGSTVLSWLATNGHSEASNEVSSRLTDGDLQALSLMNAATLRGFDQDTAESVISALDACTWERFWAEIDKNYAYGVRDSAQQLAQFNLWYPDLARWDTILNFLSSPKVTSHMKRLTCGLIAQQSAQLPEDVRANLEHNVDSIVEAVSIVDEGNNIGGIGIALSVALGKMDGDSADAAATNLASGSERDRKDAAFLLGLGQSPRCTPILASLAGDASYSVRRSAAFAVGGLLVDDSSGQLRALVRKFALDRGSGLSSALLSGLQNRDVSMSRLEPEIRQQLQQHSSARVRRQAQAAD